MLLYIIISTKSSRLTSLFQKVITKKLQKVMVLRTAGVSCSLNQNASIVVNETMCMYDGSKFHCIIVNGKKNI